MNGIRRLATVVLAAIVAVGGLTLAQAPVAHAASAGDFPISCGLNSPVQTIAVSGVVGDTITVRMVRSADCSVKSSVPGIVSWVATDYYSAGRQDWWYSFPFDRAGNPTVWTITLLEEGRTLWQAWQRGDGLNLDITVRPAPEKLPLELEVSDRLGTATEGEAYSQTLGALGGTTPYAWTLAGGTLPPGLTLSPEGELAGTPTQPGTFTFTVQVADADGNTVAREVELVVEPAEITKESLPICHLGPNGFELVMTTDDVFDGAGEHGDHAGDIVPETLGLGAGRNWGPEGIATFFNGCEAATVLATADPDGDGLVNEFEIGRAHV